MTELSHFILKSRQSVITGDEAVIEFYIGVTLHSRSLAQNCVLLLLAERNSVLWIRFPAVQGGPGGGGGHVHAYQVLKITPKFKKAKQVEFCHK